MSALGGMFDVDDVTRDGEHDAMVRIAERLDTLLDGGRRGVWCETVNGIAELRPFRVVDTDGGAHGPHA